MKTEILKVEGSDNQKKTNNIPVKTNVTPIIFLNKPSFIFICSLLPTIIPISIAGNKLTLKLITGLLIKPKYKNKKSNW
jgi:hypothetical protein